MHSHIPSKQAKKWSRAATTTADTHTSTPRPAHAHPHADARAHARTRTEADADRRAHAHPRCATRLRSHMYVFSIHLSTYLFINLFIYLYTAIDACMYAEVLSWATSTTPRPSHIRPWTTSAQRTIEERAHVAEDRRAVVEQHLDDIPFNPPPPPIRPIQTRLAPPDLMMYCRRFQKRGTWIL